jgi:hypothetical protein
VYTVKHLETALLQLDFPSFLRERTRAAKKPNETVAIHVPTNAIALASVGASCNLDGGSPRELENSGIISTSQTYMHDPSMSGEG